MNGAAYYEPYEYPLADLWVCDMIEQGYKVFSVLGDEYFLCIADDMDEALAALEDAFGFECLTDDEVYELGTGPVCFVEEVA